MPNKRKRGENKVDMDELDYSLIDLSSSSSDDDVVTMSHLLPAPHPAYEALLDENPNAIKFFFSAPFTDTMKQAAKDAHVQHVYKVTDDEAVEELRRLLVIKIFVKDHNAAKISPTPLMDTMWHAAILDTQFYQNLQEEASCVLHHRPAGASVQETQSRKLRLRTMISLYTIYFEKVPLCMGGENIPFEFGQIVSPDDERPARAAEPVRPRSNVGGQEMNIFVKTLRGKTIPLVVEKSNTLTQVKGMIEYFDGTAIDHQRLMRDGQRLHDERTLQSYGVEEGDTIHLVYRLTGC